MSQPGKYTLLVWALGYETVAEGILVGQGEDVERHVVMRRKQNLTARLSVHLTSRSGRDPGPVQVFARRLPGTSWMPLRGVTWNQDGAGNGSGTLEAMVEPGEYEVLPLSSTGWPIEPESRVLADGGPPGEFTVIDSSPLHDWEFRAVDPATGAPLDKSVQLAVRRGSQVLTYIEGQETGIAELKGFPEEPPFDWVLVAPGRRPASGRSTDLTPDPGNPGTRGVIVPLEPGWGVTLWFIDEELHEPVKGIVVSVGGEPPVLSDAAGLAELRTQDQPDSLELDLGGWEVVEPPREALEAAASLGRWGVVQVRLRRTSR